MNPEQQDIEALRARLEKAELEERLKKLETKKDQKKFSWGMFLMLFLLFPPFGLFYLIAKGR